MRVPQCLEKIPMFGKILEVIQQKVYNYSELFLESQIEAIKSTKYSAKKRSGIFVYVETFPRFVTRIETILKNSGITKGKKRILRDNWMVLFNICVSPLLVLIKQDARQEF